MSNSEEIKPVALTIFKLCLAEASVSQAAIQIIENCEDLNSEKTFIGFGYT